ncbi:MAG TPA: DUF72 domain-containing protein [Bacteroidia bacterium]|nr:DUF72 domain-containing protein [Bacteroidia bacterium]
MISNYLIGCSGYYYPAWKGKFYPKELQPKNWLSYYSSVFNSVELNNTFYKMPKLLDLQKYAQLTPNTFKFSVKINRHITHVLKLKNSKQLITDFQNLAHEGLADKLSFFLFQLPPSFHYNEENLERIINSIPHKINNVIEFRHESWWNDHVETTLKKLNLTFCNVDFPGLITRFINTSPLFYLRLHGNPALFKSSYSQTQLQNFRHQFPTNFNTHAVYFNNTYYGAAYKNALELIKMCQPVL